MRPEAGRENAVTPILAGGVLVLIAGLQLLLPGASPPPGAIGLAARRERPVNVPPLLEYAAILASPIFTPDRRPGAAGGPSDTGGGTLAGYAALGAATGRGLATGVVSSPGAGAKTLRRGDILDGWRLVAVDRTQLTFERNGTRRTLVVGAPAEAPVQPGAQAETADQ